MDLKNKAFALGATEFNVSNRASKRFMVMYNGMAIHFGSKTGKTFIDHRDTVKRRAWLARHSKIRNKAGQHVINLKSSPSYWSKHVLW